MNLMQQNASSNQELYMQLGRHEQSQKQLDENLRKSEELNKILKSQVDKLQAFITSQ